MCIRDSSEARALTCRCCWREASCSRTADRVFLGAIYGVVPPEFATTHTARDGEDYAMLMVSQHVLGTFSVLADCKATLSCCTCPQSATSVANPRAHLWLRVHSREDFPQRVFKHVKSHCSMVHVRDGVLSQFELEGNAEAD
eukprot:72977-Pyramimonas_sp.AAC.1